MDVPSDLHTLLQACKLVGGHEVVTLELLPQLVPLFLCPPDQRGAYGSSIPPANPSATQPIRSVCICITLFVSLQRGPSACTASIAD